MENLIKATPKTVDRVVEEIIKMHKTLPPRPDIEEVEAARALINNIEREDILKLEGFAKQT